ncbi:MAG: hypothetical protein RR722_18450, partial [Hafnia sp.]
PIDIGERTTEAWMPIVVRSVKTGMMKRGNPRSGLVGGAKPGCKAAAIEPPCLTALTHSHMRKHCG